MFRWYTNGKGVTEVNEIIRKTNQILDKTGIYIIEHLISDDIDIHWHEFYEIEYILNGSGTAYINDKAYELKPNTLLFLSPVDFERIETKEPLTIIDLAFSGEIILQKMISLLPYGCAIENYPDTIFKMLKDEAKINDKWFYNKYCQLINCVLIDVIRKFGGSTDMIESSPILKALHYLDLNFKNPITLEQISRYVGLSPTYFSSIFTQKMNTNFKTYLTSLRLDYAAKLLIISDFNATEICYASGFNDFSSFARAFKNYFSISPSEYRQQNKKNPSAWFKNLYMQKVENMPDKLAFTP